MAKQPYIQFYLGDYIKDTRVLPLNVKGGWVDLILAMWDNDPKGEITGTIDDFSRIMNCSKDEAILVIQTLKQKKIFDYADLDDNFIKIISRKQKKMKNLSEMRKNVGKTGGNPNLLNQKDKLIAEYEYENTIVFNQQSLSPRMVQVFKTNYPFYPVDEEKDFPSCLQIAYKIAKQKGWSKESVLNGNLNATVDAWEKIVGFSTTDKWYATRSISDFNKEFQRLVQGMVQGNKNSSTKKEVSQSTAPTLTRLNN